MANASKTNGDIWRERAEQMGIPPMTLDQVRASLENAKKYDADREAALLMLRHGRLTDEARAWVAKEYPL